MLDILPDFFGKRYAVHRVLHVSSSKPRAGYLFHFGGYIKVSIDLDFQQRENGGGLSEWCYTIASY